MIGAAARRAGGLLLLVGVSTVQATSPPTSVVLVTIDTLRADRLGAYGGDRHTSPAIDALARAGATFEHANATCPATAPSIASIITGRHRAGHGVVRNGNRLLPSVPTLAEMLGHGGRRTAAMLASPVIAETGFDRGFDTRVHSPAPVFEGRSILRAVRRFLAHHGQEPFFLWLHLLEPHGPYTPPPRFARAFPARSYGWPGDHPLPIAARGGGLFMIPAYGRYGNQTIPAAYRARYDAEIRYTDAMIGRLVRLLRTYTPYDRLVIVFTADHGESLGERGVFFQHGWDAYEPTLQVPLIVVAPAIAPGRRVTTSVSLVDVTPTILDLVDVPPTHAMEGASLVPVVRGDAGDRTAFAQTYYGNRLTVLRRGRWKYIWTPPPPFAAGQRSFDLWRKDWPTAGREELYDLTRDPDERDDLAPTQPARVRRWRRKTLGWLRRQAGAPPPGPPPAPSLPLERLRSLGYVE